MLELQKGERLFNTTNGEWVILSEIAADGRLICISTRTRGKKVTLLENQVLTRAQAKAQDIPLGDVPDPKKMKGRKGAF